MKALFVDLLLQPHQWLLMTVNIHLLSTGSCFAVTAAIHFDL